MRKLFQILAHTANIGALVAMVSIGSAQFSEAQAHQKVKSFGPAELKCLQQNIYFEAGNQSTLGQVAVAWVTLNRMQDSRFPDTICGVVRQGQQNADASTDCRAGWRRHRRICAYSVAAPYWAMRLTRSR